VGINLKYKLYVLHQKTIFKVINSKTEMYLFILLDIFVKLICIVRLI